MMRQMMSGTAASSAAFFSLLSFARRPAHPLEVRVELPEPPGLALELRGRCGVRYFMISTKEVADILLRFHTLHMWFSYS